MKKRILVYVILLVMLSLAALAGFFRWDRNEWKRAYASLEKTNYDLEKRWMQALAEHQALTKRNGELITELESWRTRPDSEREIIRDRYIKIPADCRACLENYELDKRYTNPEVDRIPARTITVEVRDVLGADKATWELDVPRLCPPCPPVSLTPPVKPGLKRLFRFEGGLGYGLVGPQAEIGLYPLSLRGSNWDVDLGAWGSGFLNQDGDAHGNAVLGIRVSRKGSWN